MKMPAVKSAKKMALMELIKHMNKKRFQDKEVDPKKAMEKAMEGSPEEEAAESPEEEDLEDAKGEQPEESEFDGYRKGYMKGKKPAPAHATLAIMIGAGKSASAKKGRGKRG